MRKAKHITITSDGRTNVLSIGSILYVAMMVKTAEIHTSDGKVYETRMTMSELEKTLGDGFIRIHRGCLVAVKAIHNIKDRVELSNGESLIYTLRKKKQIIEEFRIKQEAIIRNLAPNDTPITMEDYQNHYKCFDALPVAFTDIELVFDDEKRAVDWIFRYTNAALADLEKLPLEKLQGSSFGSLFANMDSKWLRTYELATLYGETLEIMDYSPEINTYLKIICFPTFEGHCGCMLFDLAKLKLTRSSGDAQKALMLYLSNS